MKYLLDTDHISFLQRRSAPEHTILVGRMSQCPLTDFAFSVVSFHEQALGAHTYINRSRNTAELIRGYRLLSEILQGFLNAPVLPFDVAAGAALDGLRAGRIRIAPMDLRIAAIALSRNLILLRRNKLDFNRVPGLVIEDWTVEPDNVQTPPRTGSRSRETSGYRLPCLLHLGVREDGPPA